MTMKERSASNLRTSFCSSDYALFVKASKDLWKMGCKEYFLCISTK